MGWLQLARRSQLTPSLQSSGVSKAQTEHIEHSLSTVTISTPKTSEHKHYPFQPSDTPDSSLPFIPVEEITHKRRPGVLASSIDPRDRAEHWIVIDDIVYDCTSFIGEHPGGEQVILSFVGEDCSWQFWRFHGVEQMREYGRDLRIGRTKGVKNRFSEPARFVGLSRLGQDEWD